MFDLYSELLMVLVRTCFQLFVCLHEQPFKVSQRSSTDRPLLTRLDAGRPADCSQRRHTFRGGGGRLPVTPTSPLMADPLIRSCWLKMRDDELIVSLPTRCLVLPGDDEVLLTGVCPCVRMLPPVFLSRSGCGMHSAYNIPATLLLRLWHCLPSQHFIVVSSFPPCVLLIYVCVFW